MYMFHRMAPVYLHHTSAKSLYFYTWQQNKTKNLVSLYQLHESGALDTCYPIACAMNIVSFWSGNLWGCFSTFFSFVKLTKSDGWSLEGRVVLTSATNQESQKFNFWQSELSRRFSGHCCTFTEMALFLWALHSKNTHIPLTLFVWVFAGTKPFNIAISSLLVRHLNWAPSSRVIFAFFLGGWKTLKSGSTFSFLTILKMSKTTTGSCIDHSKMRHSVA